MEAEPPATGAWVSPRPDTPPRTMNSAAGSSTTRGQRASVRMPEGSERHRNFHCVAQHISFRSCSQDEFLRTVAEEGMAAFLDGAKIVRFPR